MSSNGFGRQNNGHRAERGTKMVVMGVEEYDRMQAALALLKLIQHSEADVTRGRAVPQEEVFRRIESLIDEARRQGQETA